MKMKSLTIPILALLIRIANFQTLTQCNQPSAWDSPKATSGTIISGSSYIQDGVSHITQITLFYGGSSNYYGIQVTSGAPESQIKLKIPTTAAGCYDSSGNSETYTFTSSTQRVSQVKAWRRLNSNSYWRLYKMEITLVNPSYTWTPPSAESSPSGSQEYTFDTPPGQEFVGFFIADDYSSECESSRFAVYYRADNPCIASSCITLALSNIQGKSQKIFVDPLTTLTFTQTTDAACSACGALEYTASYSPSSTTSNLITITSSSTNSVKFAASTNKNDANTYTVTVQARFSGQTSWLTSATATYQYIDPCPTATITVNSFANINTPVLVPASQTANIWTNNKHTSCGPYTVTLSKPTIPGTYVAATMDAHFTYTTTSTQVTLNVSPTVVNAEAGTYVIRFTVCLTNYNTVCGQADSNVVITDCAVTSVQVVESPGLGNLQEQFYTLLSTTNYNYQLTTKQTPNCGYASSVWTIVAGTTISGTRPQFFTVAANINTATGLYTITPANGSNTNRAGRYTVQISSVQVNGVTYTSTSLVAPSSFILTVQTSVSCTATVVTANAPSTITLKVYDAIAYYPSPGPAFAEFTDTVSTSQGGDPTYCSKTYTATISPAGVLTTFVFDDATKTFQIYSDNLSQAQTYTVTLVGTLDSNTANVAQTTFSVVVANPCLTATLTAPASLVDMTTSVSVASGPVTQQVGVFKDSVSIATGDPAGVAKCGARSYSISSTLGSATTALSATELTIDANGLIQLQTSNSATVGTHFVTVVGSLTSYSSVQKSLTFAVTILPCVVTSVKVVQCSNSGSLSAQTYTLSSTGSLTYCIKTQQTPSCNYADSLWSVTATGGPQPSSFQTIDTAGNYKVDPITDTASSGTYTIQVQSVTVNSVTYGTSPTLTAPSSFTLTVINPCATSVITTNTISNIVLKVWDAAAFYPTSGAWFTDFADSVSTANSLSTMCAKTYTATAGVNGGGQNLSGFSFDSSTRQFWVSSQSYDQIGTFTVTVTCVITGFPATAKTTTFPILVDDPCITTSFSLPTPTVGNMQTSVLVQATPGGLPYYETRQLTTFQDVVSVAHGDYSGSQYCGPRSYTISSVLGTATTALTSTELSVDANGLISVYTANKLTVGTHSVTVTTTLQNYVAVAAATATFTLEIINCIITDFSMTLNPSHDKSYTIDDGALTWSLDASFVTTQVPPCGYQQTPSTSPTLPSFVTTSVSASTIDYSAYTRDVSFAGDHDVVVVSTLIGYNFSPARVAPYCSTSFTLTAIDPCVSTTISSIPASIGNLVAFAGYNISSQLKYSFQDSVSIARTLATDASDFCKDKLLLISVNSTTANSTIINATNNDHILFSPPVDTQDFGIAQAQVYANMQYYNSISSVALSFTVTTLGSVVPVVADQVYIQGSSPLSISYTSFGVLPSNYDAGPTSVLAYLLTGQNALPTYIDLTCACLQQITSLDWIDFDGSSSTLTVYTSNTNYIGPHTIVLVQFFDVYAGVNPYTTFSLQIEPAPVIPVMRTPPYFQPSLETQTVKQCPNDTESKLWQYKLPDYVDPNNSPVTLTANFESSFFSFDLNSMTLSQKKIIEKSVNQTIKVTLQNELNLKATYQMVVQFACEQKAPAVVYNFTVQEQKAKVAKQKQWPGAYIQTIEPSGLMRVKFNQKMKIPDHPDYIQNETITFDEVVYPILRLVVIPGKQSEMHMLKFNWTFVEFQTTHMLIQLDFENRNYVSQYSNNKDFIQLTIYGFQLFADSLGNFMSPPTVLTPKSLPLMASQTEVAAIQSFADTTKSAMQSAMLVNTIVSLVISGPLQQLLSSVKQLQIIVHIMLINLAYPPTSSIFFGMLMNVLTFQFYDFGPFYEKMLKLDPDSVGSNPLNEQFNTLGYNSLYIILNFGTLCWTIFVAPLAWAMAPLVVSICQGEYAHLKLKFNRMMFFNYWIGFFNETFLFLAVCAGLNLYYFKWNEYGDAINSLVALCFGSIITVFPFFVAIFYTLSKNYKRIVERDEDFLARFDNVLTGLNIKRRGKLVFIPTFVSLLRKLWLAYMVVFQQRKPLYSIFSVNFQALTVIITSGLAEPYSSKLANTMELVNEAFVLIMTYHLYQFTDFMTDLQNRSYVGYSLVIITVLNVVINIGIVVVSTLALSCRKLKLKYLEYQQRKRIKERFDQKLEQVKLHEARLKLKLKKEQIARRKARQQRRVVEELVLEDFESSLESPNQVQQQNPQTIKFQSQLVSNDPAPKKSTPAQQPQLKSALKQNPKYQLQQQPEVENYAFQSQTIEETKIEEQHTQLISLGDIVQSEQSLIIAKLKPRSIFETENQVIHRDQVINANQEPLESDSLEDLLKKFPQAHLKTLFIKDTVYYKIPIVVLEVTNAGEYLRISVMMNGLEGKIYQLNKRRRTAENIEAQRKEALDFAKEQTVDIFPLTLEDIQSGVFESTLQAYQIDRKRVMKGLRPLYYIPFQDFGEYNTSLTLSQKIEIYEHLNEKFVPK